MSFLFHHKTKKVMRVVWSVIAIVIMISMLLFFAPGLVNLIVG